MKMKLNKIMCIAATSVFCVIFLISAVPNSFDKAAYYKVMKSGNITGIEQQINMIETETEINKEAYTGALLMKKAGLVKGMSKKLNIFKQGHKKLESAIKAEMDNAEYRFLRLIIQEHAPKILGYHSQIDEDAKMVQANFEKFSPEVKEAVSSYRNQSGALKKLNL
jgi:hypothetical protein